MCACFYKAQSAGWWMTQTLSQAVGLQQSEPWKKINKKERLIIIDETK